MNRKKNIISGKSQGSLFVYTNNSLVPGYYDNIARSIVLESFLYISNTITNTKFVFLHIQRNNITKCSFSTYIYNYLTHECLR